jgi:hypothetical protein
MAKRKLSQTSKKSAQPRPLGDLLSEVMDHPDVPTAIYNAIANTMLPNGPVNNDPEFLQLLIDYAKEHPGSDPELDQKPNSAKPRRPNDRPIVSYC